MRRWALFVAGMLVAAGAMAQPTATHLFLEQVDDSAGLRGILTDETGSGLACFATSPTLTTPLVSGKIDADAGAVNDDDCTGEQGLFWFDDTDLAFEFCNANSGAPATLGGGSGAFSDASDPVVLNTTTKEVEIGPTLAGAAKLTVHGDADEVQLLVEGNATQTNDVLLVQTSGAAELMSLTNAGALSVNNPTNPGTGGAVGIPNNSTISWRNAANTDNCTLTVNGSDVLTFAGTGCDRYTDASVTEADLASEDYGDFTCGAGADDCVLDADVVDAAALAATAIQAGDYPAAGIDGDDINSNLAGKGLTLTAGAPDQLDADAVRVCKTLFDTGNLAATDDVPDLWSYNPASTVTDIDCISSGGTSITVTIEDDAGNDLVTSCVCATTWTDCGTVSNATMTADERLDWTTVSVSGSVTSATVCVDHQID